MGLAVAAICVVLLIFFAATMVRSFLLPSSALLFFARVFLVLAAATAAAYLYFQVRSLVDRPFVALLAEGIYSRVSSTRSFVPWETVTEIGPHTFAGCRYLGVRTSRPALVSPAWMGMFRPLNRRMAGWHLTYPIFAMPGGSAFSDVVERCLKDPVTRANVVEGFA